eukprot:tig00021248_g19626.t1
MKILGVDVGVINFAWCLIEFDPQTKESQILDWQKIALFPSARCCGRLVARLVEVTRGHSAFGLPDQIAIEGQRTGINRCIECTLHALLYGRARIVSPRAIKHFFKISNPSYKERKRGAVDKCRDLVPAQLSEIADRNGKLDDLCDAYLIALYAALNPL